MHHFRSLTLTCHGLGAEWFLNCLIVACYLALNLLHFVATAFCWYLIHFHSFLVISSSLVILIQRRQIGTWTASSEFIVILVLVTQSCALCFFLLNRVCFASNCVLVSLIFLIEGKITKNTRQLNSS